jgi:hypothetical protein
MRCGGAFNVSLTMWLSVLLGRYRPTYCIGRDLTSAKVSRNVVRHANLAQPTIKRATEINSGSHLPRAKDATCRCKLKSWYRSSMYKAVNTRRSTSCPGSSYPPRADLRHSIVFAFTLYATMTTAAADRELPPYQHVG